MDQQGNIRTEQFGEPTLEWIAETDDDIEALEAIHNQLLVELPPVFSRAVQKVIRRLVRLEHWNRMIYDAQRLNK